MWGAVALCVWGALSETRPKFTQITPARICIATSSASPIDSEWTEPASPYGVLFASFTASAGERNVWTVSTGPKISSCTSFEHELTLHTRVGGMKRPWSTSAASSGACVTSAPSSSRAMRMYSITRSYLGVEGGMGRVREMRGGT